MIATDRSLLICDSATASGLRTSGYRMACWLHVDEAEVGRGPALAVHLASLGAVHIAVSGVEASFIHDEIDDALWAAGYEIATTWHEESLSEIAWDFLNVDFVSGGIGMRCVTVLGSSLTTELVRASEIVLCLAEASKSDAG